MASEIVKTDNVKIVVELAEYQEREYLDIRQYWQDDKGEWHPTKKGVTIPPEKAEQLIEAIVKEVNR